TEEGSYLAFERRSRLRGYSDGSGDGHQHRRAVRDAVGERGLQTVDDPPRHLVEPQAGFARVRTTGAPSSQRSHIDADSLPTDGDIGVRRITPRLPRCRETSGDGFNGGALELVQVTHRRSATRGTSAIANRASTAGTARGLPRPSRPRRSCWTARSPAEHVRLRVPEIADQAQAAEDLTHLGGLGPTRVGLQARRVPLAGQLPELFHADEWPQRIASARAPRA